MSNPERTLNPQTQSGLIRDVSEKEYAQAAANFVYHGHSMTPTLRELDVMQVAAYHDRPIRAGDVIIFIPPDQDQPIVHRVVRVTPQGICTLGDNNPHQDDWLVRPADVLGQVVAAWRGQQRRSIHGGRAGQLYGAWIRVLHALDRAAAGLLRPIYYALADSGIFARLLPGSMQPRVVIFRVNGQNQWQLCWGRRVIGQYDPALGRWIIPRPFRIFIDERNLKQQPADVPFANPANLPN